MRHAPYSRRAAAWVDAQEAALDRAGVGRSTRQAIRRWISLETRSGRTMTWTPHQLADRGGISPRTVYRDLQRLQDAGLARQVEAGSRAARRAAVYQLQDAPSWAAPTPSRVTECPSPVGPLDLENHTTPMVPAPQAAARGGAGRSPRVDTRPRREGRKPHQAPKLQTLGPGGRAVQEALQRAGCDHRGAWSAARMAEEQHRTRQALRDLQAALRLVAQRPTWIEPGRERGVLVRAVQSPSLARRIRRDLKTAATPRPILGPRLPSDPLQRQSAADRWRTAAIQEARRLLQQLPEQQRDQVQAAVQTATRDLQDPAAAEFLADRVLVGELARVSAPFRRALESAAPAAGPAS